MKIKLNSLIVFFFLLIGFCFTSCDSFLEAGDVRDQIVSTLDYNNAKNISVLIQSEEGTGTTVPSGFYSVKLGYKFDINFQVNPEYCFKKWIAVTQDNIAVQVTEGISFDDETSPKTKIKITNNTTPIHLIPLCVKRIAVSGEPSPSYEASGVSRDRPIIVTFSDNVNPESFIFAENEIPEGAQKQTSSDGKIRSYVLDEQTYFKNVSITNADGYSIADYFNPPEIIGKILTVQPDKSKYIPFGENESIKTVIVTLNGEIKDMSGISMANQKFWRYQINDTTDEKANINLTCVSGTGEMYLSGLKEYSIGQRITLKFTEDSDYHFESWEYDDSIVYVADPTKPETTAMVLAQSNLTQIRPLCSPRPRVTFKLTGSNGIFSPIKGPHESIESHIDPLVFNPNSDYEFIRWEIYNGKTDEEIPNGTYLKITDPNKNETTYSFVAEVPVDEDIELTVRPIVAERPQILSYSPLYDVEGVMKDSTIQVVFDYDMDEDSIYFSDDEIGELKKDGVTQFLTPSSAEPVTDVTGKKINGYLKDDETFFKNIIIKESDLLKNYNKYFNAPVFDTPKILSIKTKSTPVLPDYSQLLVTLEKDFSYKVDNKDVSMLSSKKWIYQVNDGYDTTKPSVDDEENFCVKISDTITLTAQASVPEDPWTKNIFNNSGKINLNLKIKDIGSGPSERFTMVMTRLYDVDYDELEAPEEIRKSVNYTSVKNQIATFKKDLDVSNLEDGVYSLSFEFSDRSGQTLEYPANSKKYYFVVDNTGPDISAPFFNEKEKQTKIKVWWNYSGIKDYKKTTIKYKTKDSETWSIPDVINLAEQEGQVDNEIVYELIGGTEYIFNTVYEDFNGKQTERTSTLITRPSDVTNVRTISYDYESVTIAWDASEGYCDGYEIQYNDWTDGSLSTKTKYTIKVDGKDTTTCKITLKYRPKGPSQLNVGRIEDLDLTINSVKHVNPLTDYYSHNIIYRAFTGFSMRVLAFKASSDNYVFKFSEDGQENDCVYTLYIKTSANGTYYIEKSMNDDFLYLYTVCPFSQKDSTAKKWYKMKCTFTVRETGEHIERWSEEFTYSGAEGMLPK